MFLSNQLEIRQLIFDSIRTGKKRFILYGASGSGKSYLLENIKDEILSENEYISILLSGDDYCSERDFYPFFRLFSSSHLKRDHIRTIKGFTAKAAKAVPFAGDLSEFVVDQIFSVQENKIAIDNPDFTKEELDILFKLKHILGEGKKLIFIDNLQWWDKKSLSFLYLLLEKPIDTFSFLEDTIIIINITTGAEIQNQKAFDKLIHSQNFQSFNLNLVQNKEYSGVLQYFGLRHQLPTKLIDMLYAISNGHLQLTLNIVKYLNDTDIEEIINNPLVLQNSFLDELIEKKLSEFGAEGELIKDTLKYASIIGKSFTFRELEQITRRDKYELKNLIENANKIYLVEAEKDNGKFVHDIIREIFHGKIQGQVYRYYGAFANSLKILKPGEYNARLSCYLKAGMMKEAETAYVLEYLKRIRYKEVIDIEFSHQLGFLVSDQTRDFLNLMLKAYDAYNDKKYEIAVDILEGIEDIYSSPFRGERDYLLSICFSKSIDKTLRYKAVECLEVYEEISNIDNEGELWSRILLSLLAAYVHINQIDKARKIEKRLMMDLSERVEFDIEARDKINILRRKSSAIHDSNHAVNFTEKSVAYFGGNGTKEPWHPIEYFMALTNHSGNLIVCGRFEEAYKVSCEIAQQLKNINSSIFPRVQIALNNFVLSLVLSEKKSASEVIGIMEKVIVHSHNSADIVLLKLNYAILLALSNRLQDAYNELEMVFQKIKDEGNIESYYDFCIHSNRMVIAHLLGMKEKALEIHELCTSIIPDIGDKAFYIKRTQYIGQLIRENVVTDGYYWKDILFKHFKIPQDNRMWMFYGYGYLFSDMAYWSES